MILFLTMLLAISFSFGFKPIIYIDTPTHKKLMQQIKAVVHKFTSNRLYTTIGIHADDKTTPNTGNITCFKYCIMERPIIFLIRSKRALNERHSKKSNVANTSSGISMNFNSI